MAKAATISFGNPHTKMLNDGLMTLNDLLKGSDEDQVFVINTSDLGGIRIKGEIYLPIQTSAAGDPTLVKIPNTWIPIDLTTSVSRKTLIESPTFRRAVQNRTIRLINKETAEAVLNQQEAREEQQVLMLQANFIDDEALQALANRNDENSETIRKILAERQKHLAQGSGFEEGVTPAVLAIMNREGATSRDITTALRNIGNQITEKDLHYIMSKADTATMGTTVIAFAREGLETFAKQK